jgi:hypothetical protein
MAARIGDGLSAPICMAMLIIPIITANNRKTISTPFVIFPLVYMGKALLSTHQGQELGTENPPVRPDKYGIL